jgi:hypothetical protein
MWNSVLRLATEHGYDARLATEHGYDAMTASHKNGQHIFVLVPFLLLLVTNLSQYMTCFILKIVSV